MSLIEELRAEASEWDEPKHDDEVDMVGLLYRAATQLEAMQAEIERLNDHLLETQTLAHKWMEAHDKRAAGKPYKCPSPADLPDALAEVERLRDLMRERDQVSNYHKPAQIMEFYKRWDAAVHSQESAK